ncbi:MAG: hypothetical protein AAF529_00655 [Pseudomonadota bacterium]
MNRDQQEQLAGRFAIARAVEGVTRYDGPPAVTYSDLYNYVAGGEIDNSAWIESQLRQDTDLYQQFCDLLDLHASVQIRHVVGASTEQEFVPRIDNDQRVRLECQLSEHLQNKVLIMLVTLVDGDWIEGDDITVIVVDGQNHGKAVFRDLFDGRAQIIVDQDDPFLDLLQNANSTVYLS